MKSKGLQLEYILAVSNVLMPAAKAVLVLLILFLIKYRVHPELSTIAHASKGNARHFQSS